MVTKHCRTWNATLRQHCIAHIASDLGNDAKASTIIAHPDTRNAKRQFQELVEQLAKRQALRKVHVPQHAGVATCLTACLEGAVEASPVALMPFSSPLPGEEC